mmetsp:Transcript_17109/g.21970  ORF Transcript_17109/g.21970 Transcript_17109/m.21970 type:complete len:366 (+) Transcript_17109:33-1130(+)
MGNFFSACFNKQRQISPDDVQLIGQSESRINNQIDCENRRDYKVEQTKVKLLLLGTGESGKTTFLRQLRFLYGEPFDKEKRRHHNTFVHKHILTGMDILLQQLKEKSQTVKDQQSFNKINDLSLDAYIDEDIGLAIKKLWQDPLIQETWKRRHEFQIYETTEYFFNKIDCISKPDYIATEQDILNVRYRTIGITKEVYSLDEVTYEIFDVGGQRNERRKWIHCFDNVTAVIFMAAISEYDQVLFEDPNQNRLIESIELFTETCNKEELQKPSLLLFMNKKDLFEQKIQRKGITSQPAFRDYDGDPHDPQLVINYLVNLFVGGNHKRRRIYHHVICATDTQNVMHVFQNCKNTIMHRNLVDAGFIS